MSHSKTGVVHRTRRGLAVGLAAGLVALAAACVPPTTSTPASTALKLVVGGTLANPKAGGKIVLRDDQPVDSSTIPLADLPASALTSSALNSLLESAPLRTAAPEAAPLRTAKIASLPLRTADAPSVLLSSVSLSNGRSWDQLLAGTPFAGVPTQNITLNQVADLAADGGAPLVAALSLADLDLRSSPLRTASVTSLALGNTTLGQIPMQSPPEEDPYEDTWCPWIETNGLSCDDFSSQSTVMSLDLRGAPLRTAPLRTAPLRTADLSASPLRTAPLRTAFLEASPLRTAPLRTAVLNAAPLRTAPLRTAVLASAPLRTAPLRTAGDDLDELVDCGLVDCSSESTQTIGDAADLNAIRTAATLGQYFETFPESVTAAFTLGDLKEYGTATIGDIQSTLPDNITVADAIIALVPPKALAWEAMAKDDLNLPLHGGTPAVAVTAQFTLANGRTAEETYVEVELPPEAIYLPGSSQLVRQGGGFSIAAGSFEPGKSDGTLTFRIPAEAPAGRYNLGLLVTGTRAFTLPIEAWAEYLSPTGAQERAEASVPVLSVDPARASPVPTLGDGDLYLGVLSSTSGPMTFTVPVPAVVGSVTQVTLSNLPADFDLVGYKASTVAPVSARTFRSNGLKTPPIASTDPELGGFVAAPDVQVLRDLSLARDPATVASYSSNRGIADEKVQLVTRPGDSGNYTFQVSGYNGAVSDDVFLVTVRQNVPSGTGSCSPVTPHAPTATSTGSITSSTKTVFLVNTQRMTDVYGAAAYNTMRTKLNTVAALPEVAGTVISVDGDSAVRSSYSVLNAQPCNPAAANGVVQAISGLVDRLLSSVSGSNPWKNLTSVVLVGSDEQIPMARVADGTASSNEADYASETQQYDSAGNATAPSPLSAAQAARMMLTDDAYGSWNPIAWRDTALFLPDVALGRLVEKPSEITAALENYRVTTSRQLDSSTALVTGYDFMADGATDVNTALAAHVPSRQTLISDSWDRTTLLSNLYPAGASPKVASLNAHFDHHSLLPASGNTTGDHSDLATTVDVAANPNDLRGALVFSMGCHSGLSVPDGYLTGSATTPDAPASTAVVPGETPAQTEARRARLDWAEAFANDGAVYIGNTGYGYGDSKTVSFSERLMVEIAKRLDGSVSAGQALQFAKQGYYGSLATFSDYDQKSLMETVFYGLPFWGVGSPTTPPTTPATVTPAPDPATGGIQSAPASVTPAFATNPTTNVTTADGKAPTVVDQQPIIPRTSIDVTPTTASLEVHGYLITSLASTDTPNAQPPFARATVDTSANEPPVSAPGVAFPATLQNTNIQTEPTGKKQYVNLNVAQFFGSASDPGTGTLRRFTNVGGQALYAPTSTNDGIVPTIATATASLTAGTIQFDVTASDRKPGASAGSTVAGQTTRVVVMYRDNSGWHSANLTSAGATGGVDSWHGTGPTAGGKIDWFAQVVDAAGNVSTTSNKASLFTAPPTDGAAPQVQISATEVVAGDYFLYGGVFDPDTDDNDLTAEIDLGTGNGFQPIPVMQNEGTYWLAQGTSYLTGTRSFTVRVCDDTGLCTSKSAKLITTAPVVQVAPARNEACKLLSDGSVQCWGWNAFGQLGDGTTNDSLAPVEALPVGSATSIASGWDHTCAVMVTGAVKCWGFNNRGQIGDGTTTNRLVPTSVVGLGGVTQITAAGYHSCAIVDNGVSRTAHCWGQNDFGELGDGTGVTSSIPVRVLDASAGMTDVQSISAGRDHTCAATFIGPAYCWGRNDFGQLGDGTTNQSLGPIAAISGSFSAITGGGDHTCELATYGQVACHGQNGFGQLGPMSEAPGDTLSPLYTDLYDQEKIVAGEDFTCSTNAARELRCWGANYEYQLGRGPGPGGSNADDMTFNGVEQFDVEYQTGCLVAGGRAYCWGSGDIGQAGGWSYSDVEYPTVITSIQPTF